MQIIFNNLDLNDAVNYFVESINNEDVATQEVNVQKIARTNESVILRKNFGEKTIKAVLIVKDSTQANLDARIDTLKQTIEAMDKNLDIDYSGGTRRYVCTGFVKGVDRKLTWAKINLEFVCYKAFGEDTTSTVEEFNDKTTTPYTDDIEIVGSAPAQPDIQININSITPGTGDKFMQIRNTDNGDYVKITADDFQADDIIIISTRTALVTRNGNVIEYLGIMPEWGVGVNNWEYSDDFTARQVDIMFSYKKLYI
jgi:hypothetical protein